MSVTSQHISFSYQKRARLHVHLKAFLHLFQKWRTNARTRQQLAELEDHLLDDIGVSRKEALREANKPFYL